MDAERSGLVDITRDFLLVYQQTGRIADRYRSGELRFEEVQELVGSDESCALYRLKERCHALFRRGEAAGSMARWREALFDLAVGALFHEAMKFRENFYQREVYGPKVRALRGEVGEDAEELFAEFDRILAATSLRLDEALGETEALLGQTRRQFRMLLHAHRDNGLVTRYLVENASLAEEVFENGLEALLAEIHDSAAAGYALAARSYLASGYFQEARRALREAAAQADAPSDLAHLEAYADGMSAFLDGRYREAVEHLGAWLEAAPAPALAGFAELAYAALTRIGPLVDAETEADLPRRAAALARQLEPVARAAEEPAPA